ncbi:MAG TPA: prepilin-type N-terminal cleavage/methylation domain-containing protein [Deltaproteobacteria bacterium]|nr:prepilin-type N-terminal cleavage/methylation domain-containing protein [Deltaproteobacteria bacterium]
MKSRGITLLELLVVMVIVSIMAAIALPNLGDYISRKKLSRQCDEFTAFLSRAREKAMEQGITWRVLVHPEKGEWLGYGDTNNNHNLETGEEHLGPFYLTDGISCGSHASVGPNNSTIPDDAVSFQNNRISFSSMGCCNAGTIYLMSHDRSMAIRLLPSSGLVRIWEYKDSWEVVK